MNKDANPTSPILPFAINRGALKMHHKGHVQSAGIRSVSACDADVHCRKVLGSLRQEWGRGH